MCHELPAMLSNRVFPVLILTAKRGKHAFIIVQIPVDVSGLTAAMYSNGRNLQEGDCALKRKKPVLGCGNESLALHGVSADFPPVPTQALSTAECYRTGILSG